MIEKLSTKPATLSRTIWSRVIHFSYFTLNIQLHRRPYQKHTAHMLLHNRLAALREEQGLSSAQICEQLHITAQTLAALESGHYIPSLELAFHCSALFKQPIETIFAYPEQPLLIQN